MATPSATSSREYQLDPVLDFMRLLWSIEHGLQSNSKRMESRLGITGPQRLVLRVVAQFPGLSAGELAHIVRLHPSTITGILKRLVGRGLLQRTPDPGDTRRIRLRLKRAAVSHTRASPGTIEAAVTRALDHVGASNVRAARRVLTEIAKQLNSLGGRGMANAVDAHCLVKALAVRCRCASCLGSNGSGCLGSHRGSPSPGLRLLRSDFCRSSSPLTAHWRWPTPAA
jgi:MarR family transcriptional regulator, organic hydroperoxide resistance regulator